MCEGTITVKKIVTDWLREHGFDGLWHDNDCGCMGDELFVCMGCGDQCQPGYRLPCTCGGECNYHIGPKREEASDE